MLVMKCLRPSKLEVLQFLDYKDNPGAIKSLFNQVIVFRKATDEERFLWRSIMHLIEAQDDQLVCLREQWHRDRPLIYILRQDFPGLR